MFIVTEVAPYPHGPAGVHGVLPQAAVALAEIGAMAGLEPVIVTDVSSIPTARLESGAVLGLFTIGETPWSTFQRSAIEAGVWSGRIDVLAVHSATDSCLGWDYYGRIVGARFDGHPWTTDFEVEVTDPHHPATRVLPEHWSWHDEVYLFRDLREDADVLLRVAPGQLDMSVKGARIPECGLPLAWCHKEGEGRVFSTSLGHFPSAWESPVFLGFVAGGLGWILEGSTAG
jgi:type 1 glutamine amidotransferase